MRPAAAALAVLLFAQAAPPQPALQWFRLGGMIVDSHGHPPLPGSTVVTLSGLSGSESMGIDQSGQFEFVVPVPATYRLVVGIHAPSDRTLLEYAARELALAPGAAIPFVIVTKPAVRLAGRVTIEGEPRQPGDAIAILAADTSGLGGSLWIDPADVDDHASFVFPACAGPRLLRPQGAGMRTRTLKAVLRNGVDVTDVPTDYTAGDTVEVIVTSRISILTGTVTLPGGSTADAAQVFLFADDRAAWLPHSSRVYVTRAGMDGRYGFRAIRPGRYLIAAVPFSGTLFPYDPPRDRLERIAPIARPIAIAEGDTHVADLTQEITEGAEGTDQTSQRRNGATGDNEGRATLPLARASRE